MTYFFGTLKFEDRDKYLAFLTKKMKGEILDLFIGMFDKADNITANEFIETFINEWLSRIEAGQTLLWKEDKLYAKNYEA